MRNKGTRVVAYRVGVPYKFVFYHTRALVLLLSTNGNAVISRTHNQPQGCSVIASTKHRYSVSSIYVTPPLV